MAKKKKRNTADYLTVTFALCVFVVLLFAVVLLFRYLRLAKDQDALPGRMAEEQAFNDLYFSDRILNGVTVDGVAVGGLTKAEARAKLENGTVQEVRASGLILRYRDSEWKLGRDVFAVDTDYEDAAQRAWQVGRRGTPQEKQEALAKLERGETIDVSTGSINDTDGLRGLLSEIAAGINKEKKDATVSFSFNTAVHYYYTNEVVGVHLDVEQALKDICALVREQAGTITYELKPEIQQPAFTRADLEKKYQLVAKYSTYISRDPSQAERRNNISIALECFNGRTWMPGETLSFNQWVGERTAEKGFEPGVFINEEKVYDKVTGGGICQVSSTLYYCTLLCGANMVGRGAPIEIIERRPHSWPSTYISAGLDATVSWPHTDLKLFNNSSTPYFIRTYMGSTSVNVEIYGMPLPNDAKVTIETEQIKVLEAHTEYIADSENKYHLSDGKVYTEREARNGQIVNVYQIWKEPGKETVKSLITESRYEPVDAIVYYYDIHAQGTG